jgi:hypothetical protein
MTKVWIRSLSLEGKVQKFHKKGVNEIPNQEDVRRFYKNIERYFTREGKVIVPQSYFTKSIEVDGKEYDATINASGYVVDNYFVASGVAIYGNHVVGLLKIVSTQEGLDLFDTMVDYVKGRAGFQWKGTWKDKGISIMDIEEDPVQALPAILLQENF